MVTLSIGSWKTWLIIIVVVIIVIWLFEGGRRDREVVGLNPLMPPSAHQFQPAMAGIPQPIPEGIPSAAPPPNRRTRSNSEALTAEVFAEIISECQGDIREIRHNVRLAGIVNPETNRRLEFDMYYSSGNTKIAVEYNGRHHYDFPNHIHPDTPAGRRAFDAQVRRDRYKLEAAERKGICLIRVPHTVDTCDLCETEPSGYRRNPRLTIQERRRRLKEYLRGKIDFCLNQNIPDEIQPFEGGVEVNLPEDEPIDIISGIPQHIIDQD